MTQRDWQKDMELCKGFLEDSGWSRRDLIAEQPQMSMYWLQEAKELEKIASGRGEAYLKIRKLLQAVVERERQLVEAIEFEIANCKGESRLRDLLVTLYPDTPAPKEGVADDEPI
jgi:hypothetical protein